MAPPERHLFRTGKLHGNVVLNFTQRPKEELAPQGEAYHRAAQQLAQHLLEQNGYSDLDAYPIVFLYRQALELLFKAVLLHGNTLAFLLDREELGTAEKFLFSRHGLSEHLPKLDQIFRAVGWEDAFDSSGLSNPTFIETVKEFEQFDPGSYAFRYTVNRDGAAALPHHFVFSIEFFVSIMDPLLDALYGATLGLREYVQEELNARAEHYSDIE